MHITPFVKLKPDTSFVTAFVVLSPRPTPFVVARFGKLVFVAAPSARPRSGGSVNAGFVATGVFVGATGGSVEFVENTVAEPGSAKSGGTELLVLVTVELLFVPVTAELFVSTIVVVPEPGSPGSDGGAATADPAGALTALLLKTAFIEFVEPVKPPAVPTSRLARTN